MNNLVAVSGVRGFEKDGVAYLNLEDCARGLGFTTVAASGNECVRWQTVKRYLDDLSVAGCCNGNLPDFIPENVFYRLAMKAKNETAEKFQAKVADEILPAIRKTGGYLGNTADMSDMEIMAKAFLISKRTIEEKDELITKLSDTNKKLLPKAEFFDAVAESKSAIEMASVAKVLDMGIGRNNLFEVLRQNKILMGNNQPYQKFVDMGLFRVIEQKFTKPNGDTCINIKTLVYQKGVDYIRKLLSERSNEQCKD